MEYFLWILFPSLISVFIWKLVWKHEITTKEIMIGCGAALATSILLSVVVNVAKFASMHDVEILNGYVESKQRTRVSCEHSYQCNCVTICSGSGKNRSCSQSCSTCYEHGNDWDWDVKTTVGSVTINRVDRRGSKEPPRWTAVQINEPASRPHSYINYLKGSKDSLLHVKKETLAQYKDKLFSYPSVHDYFKVKTVINKSSLKLTNEEQYIREKLRTMGRAKQVNIVAVFTDEDKIFYEALLSHWGGVKKNDVVMMFGMSGTEVEWFKSTSFADGMNNRELHIKLRQALQDKEYDFDLFKSAVALIESDFNRIPNSKFEYMVENVKPPTWLVVLNVIINLIITGFISYRLANNYDRETNNSTKTRTKYFEFK